MSRPNLQEVLLLWGAKVEQVLNDSGCIPPKDAVVAVMVVVADMADSPRPGTRVMGASINYDRKAEAWELGDEAGEGEPCDG